MEIFTGIILYLCYWWLAFMVALPCGVRVGEVPEQQGFADSAPTDPKVGTKFWIATIVAAILWTITFVMVYYKVVKIID